ncbi:MAG: methyltransferase domain-containing protein [Gemmatimonadota bacterium]
MAIPLESKEPDPKRTGSGKQPGPRSARRRRKAGSSGIRTEGQGRSWADPPQEAARCLDTFDRSLQARQRLALTLRLLGRLDGKRCLLLTPGEDEGAFAFHLRASGGCWVWATTDAEPAAAMGELLGEKVHIAAATATPFGANSFDRIVVTNAQHLLLEGEALGAELARLLVPGGVAVLTAPHARPLLARRLLQSAGSGRRASGNGSGPTAVRAEHIALPLLQAGLEPVARGNCARLFTRLVDRTPGMSGRPARLVAALDYLLPASGGAELALAARKQHNGAQPTS